MTPNSARRARKYSSERAATTTYLGENEVGPRSGARAVVPELELEVGDLDETRGMVPLTLPSSRGRGPLNGAVKVPSDSTQWPKFFATGRLDDDNERDGDGGSGGEEELGAGALRFEESENRPRLDPKATETVLGSGRRRRDSSPSSGSVSSALPQRWAEVAESTFEGVPFGLISSSAASPAKGKFDDRPVIRTRGRVSDVSRFSGRAESSATRPLRLRRLAVAPDAANASSRTPRQALDSGSGVANSASGLWAASKGHGLETTVPWRAALVIWALLLRLMGHLLGLPGRVYHFAARGNWPKPPQKK